MLERSSISPQARSKAQQAAEERYRHIEDRTFVTEIAVKATLRQAFLEGWKAALPETPDPAVIEAMAKAIDPHALEILVYDWPSGVARAAYAALRGAMQ